MGTLGLKVVYAGRNPVVELVRASPIHLYNVTMRMNLLIFGYNSIIAVHGLGARPDWAWVYKTGERDHEGNERLVNWLSDADMLPSQMPDSRIMTFNYESQWILGDLRQRQSSCATQLLTALDNMRNEVHH